MPHTNALPARLRAPRPAHAAGHRQGIEPTEEWVESQVPDTIKPYCFVKPTEDNIDYEAMNQAYCNIIAGACFALGLRFAGSGDEDARDTALQYAKLFIAIMCGRGDIPTLRVCRRLRARTPAAAPPAAAPLTHGGQMAVHCTIGLLFLGGGRATLSTTPTAVAALLAAFFPKFPTHSEDNRYHLQAFRHLYVLAVEARLILPRDISTEKLCYAHIQIRNFVKQYLVKDVGANVCGDCLVVSRRRKGRDAALAPCSCRAYTRPERDHLQGLAMLTYDCVVKDILCDDELSVLLQLEGVSMEGMSKVCDLLR
ncbi:hypothetical protein HF086_018198 [Spodoptera exigua]|uniref:Anaphase-promoting complex subunit 1 n=1 Tax=Spodoptera exigua TaxID=7107 RepID=A0A922MKT1_SPOEX|nr:hypothetical protein HF086_018198 [Spodoptera exigua]